MAVWGSRWTDNSIFQHKGSTEALSSPKKIRGLAGHFTRFLRHLHLLTNPEADRRKGQRHREDTFTPVVSDERHAADSRAVEREEVPEGSHRKKKTLEKNPQDSKSTKNKNIPKKNTFKRQIHYPPLVTNQHKPPLKKWMDGWKTSITFPFFWGGWRNLVTGCELFSLLGGG